MKEIRLLFVLMIYYLSCNISAGHTADTTKILFIGSSIIGYYHSVPDILDSLAVYGDTTIVTGDASLTGYTFERHVNNPATIAKIAIGIWDYAYLACWGGVTNDTEDEYTYPWLEMLCDSLRKYNSNIKIILSMNHIMDSDVFYAGASGYDDPYWNNFYRSVLDKNVTGYKEIADYHNTILDPFALVWDEVYIKKLPGINLYGPDNAHLNGYGAYLMASDVYSIIFGTSPIYLNYTYNLDSDTCSILREASDKIILGSPEEWGIILSINDYYESNPRVLIYPNPASSYINLDIEPGEAIRIELIDYSTGNSVLSQNMPAGKEKKLHIGKVPVGLYIVKIIAGNKTHHSKMVILR